jgi:hypothetical protein
MAFVMIPSVVLAQPPMRMAGAPDPDVLVLGDWSKPVKNKYGFAVRGRLMMCEYPNHRGSSSGTSAGLYVELQEYSDFVGATGEIYWNPRALTCELTDSSGKAVPMSGGAYGGPIASSGWIKLPSGSSMRLRVSPYGGGRLSDGGFGVWAAMPPQTLKPGDPSTYFLSGDFTAKRRTDYKPADFRYVWTGTLKLPKLELSLKRLQGVK